MDEEGIAALVKLIFKDGSNYVDPNAGPQPPTIDRFKTVLDNALLGLRCPNHGANSYATLLVNVDREDSSWEIIDSCCAEFSAEVGSEMPFPWNHAGRHLKS